MTPAAALTDLLSRYDRVALAGVGGSWKTTLSLDVTDRPVVHTDDWIPGGAEWEPGVGFTDVPRVVAVRLSEIGARWLVEGVRAPAVVSHGAPAQAVLFISERHSCAPTPSVEQRRAASGRVTNWRRHRDALIRAGVEVVEL